MERNTKTAAVVIGTQKLGEINKSLTLLTPDLGIIRAVIYGGQKSRKALRPPLFSIGTFYLLANPTAHSWSLTDAELDSRCPFEFDLDSVPVASFMAELSQKIGESDCRQVFTLLSDALIALAVAQDQIGKNQILIQFVWHLVKIAGLVSDINSCPVCERRLGDKEISYFNSSINSFCCEPCSDNKALILGPGARKYLALTSQMDFLPSLEVVLNEATSARIRRQMITYVTFICDHQLRTVSSGML